MIPVEPRHPIDGWARVVFAKNQPEYEPLVANVSGTMVRAVETEWELSAEEMLRLAAGGRVRLTLLTFGSPLNPIVLQVVRR